jgi:hypothetical protein
MPFFGSDWEESGARMDADDRIRIDWLAEDPERLFRVYRHLPQNARHTNCLTLREAIDFERKNEENT